MIFRKLLACVLCLLTSTLAVAAGYNSSASASGFSGTLSATVTGVTAGDTILVFTSGQSAATGATDGTAYTQVGTGVTGSGDTVTVWKLLSAASGSHAVTVTFTGSNGQYIVVADYTAGDVTGTPLLTYSSFPGAGANTITGTTTPAVANAILVGFVLSASVTPTYSAGTSPNAFTGRTTGVANTILLLEDFTVSGGSGAAQTVTFGNTANSGNVFVALALAPAGGGGGSCTNSGYTSAGAIAVPNGTTGSYVGNAGAFVTPNCSSIPYWQPSGGKFGTTGLLPLMLLPLGGAIGRGSKLC